ncbi:hypothetical protein [Paucilactobacillus nenjiangensis]|uniref:hypothetical protein n=1 Tax=Paucilactobacillus nenjiangensis TaxID=1296540 RepID=UPI003BB7CFF6
MDKKLAELKKINQQSYEAIENGEETISGIDFRTIVNEEHDPIGIVQTTVFVYSDKEKKSKEPNAKLGQLTEALSGLTYRQFVEITQKVDSAYHVTKKELTPEEISSHIQTID